MDAPQPPLRLMVVAGFLGAGKTTLMRRLLEDARERQLHLAVVVNEYGAVDIDSNILREADAELLASVSGGCACCSGQDDLTETLLELATRPAERRPDVVLIETSGLADPVMLLEVLAGPRLLPRLRITTMVAVADAARYEKMAALLSPLLLRQIELADLIVLNKVDLLDESGCKPVIDKLRQLNTRARILPAEKCAIALDELWSAGLRDGDLPDRTVVSAPAPHTHFHTVSLAVPHPVGKENLQTALAALPVEVWRAKGFVRLRGEEGLTLVQYTGGGEYGGRRGTGTGRFQLVPFILSPGMDEPPASLVFIGGALDQAALERSFSPGALGSW